MLRPTMRLYPDVPSRRLSTVLGDALVLVLLVLFAWLGLTVHDAVGRLAVLGTGVRGAGEAVQGGFESAADRVEGVPLVGGEVAGGLRGAGEGTGGEVAELGEQGESAAQRLARLLGLLVFGLPAALLLARWLPARVEQVRALTAATSVLSAAATAERRRLIAMRAAFSLPYGQLLRYTPDPLGDLAEERYDSLVAAALDDVGLQAPPAGAPAGDAADRGGATGA
jgi:hypothetical protein